jgi:RHS repeat-associated protein
MWVKRINEDITEKIPFRFTGKEYDDETKFYYYGARYLNPKLSRWLTTDPAVNEYIPGAPINEEAKKHNNNLPGLGGVYNIINLHTYHYAANNPVKYVDPDGREDIIAKEPEVKEYLKKILDDPKAYKIEAYQRKAMGKGERDQLRTHSFYVITDKEGKKVTLSFNGNKIASKSEGAWALNTDMDQKSLKLFKVEGYNRINNPYDVVKITPEGGIDVSSTVGNIIAKIDSSTTYYYKDHQNNLPEKDNCNTALYETMIPKRHIK